MSCGRTGYLKTKEGKFMDVFEEQLEVRDVQGGAKKEVTVHRWAMDDGGTTFAFSFSKSYFFLNQKGALELSGMDKTKHKHFMFEWKDIGSAEHRGLRSVADNTKHLSCNDDVVLFSSKEEEVLPFRLVDDNDNDFIHDTVCTCWQN